MIDFVAVAVFVELEVACVPALSELVDLVADAANVDFLAAVSGFAGVLEGEDGLVADLVAVALVEEEDAFADALELGAVADDPGLGGGGVVFAFAELVLVELLVGAADDDLAAVGADLAGLAVAEGALLVLVAGAADADLVGAEAALGVAVPAALADLVVGAVVGALAELAAAFGLVVVAEVGLPAGLIVEAVTGAEAFLGAAVDV